MTTEIDFYEARGEAVGTDSAVVSMSCTYKLCSDDLKRFEIARTRSTKIYGTQSVVMTLENLDELYDLQHVVNEMIASAEKGNFRDPSD